MSALRPMRICVYSQGVMKYGIKFEFACGKSKRRAGIM